MSAAQRQLLAALPGQRGGATASYRAAAIGPCPRRKQRLSTCRDCPASYTRSGASRACWPAGGQQHRAWSRDRFRAGRRLTARVEPRALRACGTGAGANRPRAARRSGADAAYVEALEPARSELQRAEAAMTATTAGSPATPTPPSSRSLRTANQSASPARPAAWCPAASRPGQPSAPRPAQSAARATRTPPRSARQTEVAGTLVQQESADPGQSGPHRCAVRHHRRAVRRPASAADPRPTHRAVSAAHRLRRGQPIGVTIDRPARQRAFRRGGSGGRCPLALGRIRAPQTQLEGIESAAWALRLVQIEPSLHDLARHAKDLAQASQKRVRVVVQAGSVEIERPVLDSVWQPLLHILRNAIDHGIEPPPERQAQNKPSEANLVLHAEAAGPQVILTVSDDGRGINREDVRRAAIARGMLPANHPAKRTADLRSALPARLFTRSTVSELSGRGVGLDVVRSQVLRGWAAAFR